MERIELVKGLSFSKIIHGWWRAENWNNSSEENLRLIEECLKLGITTFDHADIYSGGICEELFGKALSLKPELRNKIEIVTKCGITFIHPNMPKNNGHYYDTSYEHIMYTVNKSLKGLQTDYIDLLLIHRPDIFMNTKKIILTEEQKTLVKKEVQNKFHLKEYEINHMVETLKKLKKEDKDLFEKFKAIF